MRTFAIACCLIAVTGVPAEDDASRLQSASMTQYQEQVAPLLKRHCSECHGDKKSEKELHLAKLEPDMKASSSAARWATVLEQLRRGEMPPKDQPRLAPADLEAITTWITGEMKRAGKHVARREAYVNGNSIDHSALFDPNRVRQLDSPPGVRRLSAEIYTALTTELAKGINGLGQPFTPAGKTTFKDMGSPKIDEPTTAQLIRNALIIVEQKLTAHKVENGEIKGQMNAPKQFLRLIDTDHPPTPAEIESAINHMFELVIRRKPTKEEVERFTALYEKNVTAAGHLTGTRYTLAAILLLPEVVMRFEHGGDSPDEAGRVRLAPREIAFALSFALTDRRPETWLLTMAEKGELEAPDGVAAAVQRMLNDPKLEKPRIKRFFREYFQYDHAEEIFKDSKEFSDHDPRTLIEDTDRLIESILEQDQNVLAELLTTNKAFVAYKTAASAKKQRAEALAKFEAEKQQNPEKFANKKPPKPGRSAYESYNLTDFPDEQPIELPKAERAGILTQPSWLVSFSKSDDNHAIHRGKWVRERLLGNVVPDIPITVDAQLPIAPEKTLRERMTVTQENYCWQCHKLMNRTGYPFESFDHFGRFRTMESVLDLEATAKHVDGKGKPLGNLLKGIPVDSSGGVEFSGDERIEGNVQNIRELMERLAKSERVEQVFVRHAFRYWLGRNENLGDAASLQAAHRAYHQSGGSMKALIVALLTSESFLYRTATPR